MKSLITTTPVFLAVAILCLLFSAGCTTGKRKTGNDSHQLRVEVFKNDSAGYGYEIYENGKVFIKQSFIPGVPGRKSFRNEDDARKVAGIVMKRLAAGEIYSIFEEDLDSLGIIY